MFMVAKHSSSPPAARVVGKIVVDNSSWQITRHELKPNHGFSLLPEIYVERGTKADWDLLHALHYKAEELGIGPRHYRCVLHGETIGVGVMTVPKMLSAGRNEVMPNMRPNQSGRDTRLMNRHRAKWINAFSCTNSRLVLDTVYRGAGIAYRMQNLMMRMTGCHSIEFQSAMSKANPFAAKAGIQFTRPRRSNCYKDGLQFFRRWFVGNPSDLVGVMEELAAMPTFARETCIAETRKFYYRHSAMEKSGDNRMNGTSRVDAMTPGYLIKSLQQLVFASPLYGLYQNPDHKLKDLMPARLPLIAFDNQGLYSPLDLDAAAAQLSKIEASTPLIDLNWEENESHSEAI